MSYIKKKSKKQENRTAKEFGGLTQIASGAIDGMKGDVRTNDYLIENKFTDSPNYTVDFKIWNKIFKEAIRDGGRTPLLQVDIRDTSVVIMDLPTFDSLFSEYTFTYTHIHQIKGDTKKINQQTFDEIEPLKVHRLDFNKYDVTLMIVNKDMVLGCM